MKKRKKRQQFVASWTPSVALKKGDVIMMFPSRRHKIKRPYVVTDVVTAKAR